MAAGSRGAPPLASVEIHHLREWADGGATDLDNQVSLCPAHHDAIARGDFTSPATPPVLTASSW